MGMMMSNGLRAAMLAGGSGFKSLFDGGAIFLFGGAQPAGSEQAMPSPIAVISELGGDYNLGSPLNGLVFRQPDNAPYMLPAVGSHWRLRGLNSGAIAWGRLVGPTDNGQLSYELPRIDFPVNPPEGVYGGFYIDTADVTPQTNRPIQGWIYAIPPLPES